MSVERKRPGGVKLQPTVEKIAVGSTADGTPASADLACFAPDPRNHRKNTGSVTALGESMKRRGQLQAVVAVSAGKYRERYKAEADRVPPGVEMVVIIGERRLRAAHEAGLSQLEYVLKDHLLETEDYRAAALDENEERLDVTCMDVARLLHDWLQVDQTHGKVAERVGKSRVWVQERLALLELIQEFQDAIDERQLGMREAREFAGLSAEQQQSAYAKWEKTQQQARAQEAEAKIPAARGASKPPTAKAARSILARYRAVHGADGVAALLRDELDGDNAVTFVTSAVAHLPAQALDDLVDALTALRAKS
jgi:ParB family chromosome partitioning protein